MGGIDLYQQTKDERREAGTGETTARCSQTCRDQAQALLRGRPEGGGGGGKKGKKGSSRAATGQVCAQSQLTSSTRPRKERVKARGAIRYDALDTSQPERKAHSASPHHSATHTTTWMPTCQADIDAMPACLPTRPLPSCPMSNSHRSNLEGKRQTSPQRVSEASRRGQPPLSVSHQETSHSGVSHCPGGHWRVCSLLCPEVPVLLPGTSFPATAAGTVPLDLAAGCLEQHLPDGIHDRKAMG